MISAYDLSGKVALVTGAAGGIGRATATLLAERGADVVAVDLDTARLDAVAAEIRALGRQALAQRVDLGDPDQIRASVAAALERFGHIDILVNNAGITATEPLVEMSVESWDAMHDVNLRGTFVYMQEVARAMIAAGSGGRIVNLSSSSAFRALRSNVGYGSSKAGVLQLTRSAAGELGAHGINVNAVAPGLTRTPMTEPYFEGSETIDDAVRVGPLANLLHRFSVPRDVAEVIVFLCSEASRQITGQCLHTSAGAVV